MNAANARRVSGFVPQIIAAVFIALCALSVLIGNFAVNLGFGVERVHAVTDAGTGVSVSVRISNEIDCEADPQTNVYFDIVPAEGGEVMVNDGGVIRRFDAVGSYEEGGLSGYFGNGAYQEAKLIPKSGYVLAQSPAISFTVASQCDADGNPILSPLSTLPTTTPTTEPSPLPPQPTLPPPEPEPAPPTPETIIEPVLTTPPVEITTETVAETDIVVPPIAACGSEEECAQLCAKGAEARACAVFANQAVVAEPLSSLSAEKTDIAALATAVHTFFEERGGIRAFTDTDLDGIVDFDEVNVYGTDPKKADSDKDGVPDGAELLANTNPSISSAEVVKPVAFEDPNTHGALASSTLIVSAIAVNATTTDASGTSRISSMTLSGKAPVNSFVTIFIYSEPIVVTVKTDSSGTWTYTLTKELPDGTHKVFAAVSDSGGRVLAKSEPLPFVQTASAITIGSAVLLPSTPEVPTFFGRTGLVTMFVFFLVVLIVAIFIFGMIRYRKEEEDKTGTPSAA